MASRRLLRLRAHAIDGLARIESERDIRLAFVAIEALNLWGNFARSYALSCLYHPKTVTKGVVKLSNAAISTPANVLLIAAQVRRGPAAVAPTTRRDEPAWHERDLLIKTCIAMGCSNSKNIQAALSLGTTVFEGLPRFRNFYAHRNFEAAESAIALAKKHYLITGAHHPTTVLATPAYKRTQPLILDWLDELQSVMELLCD